LRKALRFTQFFFFDITGSEATLAFKKTQPPQNIPDSPEKILLQLPRRKIPGVLFHQGQIMQRYATEAVAAPDVALQLLTGSGKTLVGLLIAEWRRRKFNEKVVYLCPTRQLVNQVVSQAEQQYGLAVNGFVGSKADYSPAAKAEYQSAAKIAVTTYSSLFNSHPYFDAPDVIILDDAHAAENYIAAMWSLRIDGSEKSEQPLFTAISALLRPFLSRVDFARLEGSTHPAITDPSWVDKIPAPAMLKISGELAAIIDQYAAVNDEIKYSWQTIKNHLDACNLFISSKEILIRPLIPPTWTHRPFEHAKQRIFMSATLGEGGDLERLTGRKKIMRIPVPEGMDRQGIGRRFFIFPEISIRRDAVPELMAKLCKMVPRSVFLVPSKRDANQITKLVEWMGNTAVDAEYIEKSKSTFTGATNVAAVIANRYDGIDFPGDECRPHRQPLHQQRLAAAIAGTHGYGTTHTGN
jgi:Rad3-related DNA helicase